MLEMTTQSITGNRGDSAQPGIGWLSISSQILCVEMALESRGQWGYVEVYF